VKTNRFAGAWSGFGIALGRRFRRQSASMRMPTSFVFGFRAGVTELRVADVGHRPFFFPVD